MGSSFEMLELQHRPNSARVWEGAPTEVGSPSAAAIGHFEETYMSEKDEFVVVRSKVRRSELERIRTYAGKDHRTISAFMRSAALDKCNLMEWREEETKRQIREDLEQAS